MQGKIPYVAGLFDGEGTIHIGFSFAKNYVKVTVSTSIAQSPKQDGLIEKINNIITGMDKKLNIKFYNYSGVTNIYITNPIHFLKIIYPYLIIKRKQAKIMINDIYPMIRKSSTIYINRKNKRKNFLKLMRKVEKLNALKGGRRGKYNSNFFRRIWGFKIRIPVDMREPKKMAITIINRLKKLKPIDYSKLEKAGNLSDVILSIIEQIGPIEKSLLYIVLSGPKTTTYSRNKTWLNGYMSRMVDKGLIEIRHNRYSLPNQDKEEVIK